MNNCVVWFQGSGAVGGEEGENFPQLCMTFPSILNRKGCNITQYPINAVKESLITDPKELDVGEDFGGGSSMKCTKWKCAKSSWVSTVTSGGNNSRDSK